MERQEATRLSEIHPGHLARYEFAATRCQGRVLDAACGVGYGSWILHEAQCLVTGVDIEPEAIAKARTYYKCPDYLKGDVWDAPWIPMLFDWCVSFETIEHIDRPEEALESFRDSCKRLIISTPNQEKYPFDSQKFNGDKYPHLRHYTPGELDTLLKESGWEVLQRFTQVGKTSPVSAGTHGMFLVYVCR